MKKYAFIVTLLLIILLGLIVGPIKHYFWIRGAKTAINQLWLSYDNDSVKLQLLMVGGQPITLYEKEIKLGQGIGVQIELKEEISIR